MRAGPSREGERERVENKAGRGKYVIPHSSNCYHVQERHSIGSFEIRPDSCKRSTFHSRAQFKRTHPGSGPPCQQQPTSLGGLATRKLNKTQWLQGPGGGPQSIQTFHHALFRASRMQEPLQYSGKPQRPRPSAPSPYFYQRFVSWLPRPLTHARARGEFQANTPPHASPIFVPPPSPSYDSPSRPVTKINWRECRSRKTELTPQFFPPPPLVVCDTRG